MEGEAHPPLEMLARWMSGRLEHDHLVQEVAPHFLPRCPVCWEKVQEIRRLQAEVGHWDEEIAVHEAREAPELMARLAAMSFDEQWRAVGEDESFHAWGLCQLLLHESADSTRSDPALAADLATLAVRIAERLGDAYDPNWVLDLRAKAWARLGNARRVLGELKSADEAFRRAEELLGRSTTGDERVRAEIWDLEASLRRDQRRFDVALELLDRAIRFYRSDERHPHLAAHSLVNRASVLIEAGVAEAAVDVLREAEALVDAGHDPRLLLCLRHNLLDGLTKLGRYDEAQAILPDVEALAWQLGGGLDLVRLRWTAGRVALGLGKLGPAEAAFREVRDAFLEHRMGYDAALVSLDLALLYAQEGATAELKRLAAEIVPVFESHEVKREAMAALLMFQHACEEETLTVKLVQHLASLLARERRPPGG